MANVSKFIIGDTEIEVKDSTARDNIGDLDDLETTAKNNLVAAINEAKTSGGVGISYNSATENITFTS